MEGNFGATCLLGPMEDHEMVSVVTLDETFPTQCVDFVKLDIEGMETQAIEGAHHLLKRCHPTLYVEVGHVQRVSIGG